MADAALLPHAKFSDPEITAHGEKRARVALEALRTLWINTGSLCNIECRNCYIESSPENDRLAYITRAEIGRLSRRDRTRIVAGARDRLHRRRALHESRHHRHARRCACPRLLCAGSDQRHAAHAAPAHSRRAAALRDAYGSRLVMRVSLDHYAQDAARGRAGRRTRSTRRSRGSIGSRPEALRLRLPAAPAGARARRTPAPATPR